MTEPQQAAARLVFTQLTAVTADGWLAPLAPEGASAIMYRDIDHAADLAEQQGIRAADLAAAGVVDEVVTGPPAQDLARGLGRAVHRALAELTAQDRGPRLAARADRYRHLGG